MAAIENASSDGRMQKLLTPEKAYIFRITHRDNLPWIVQNGLHCASSDQRDPNFVPIGNAELIGKRSTRNVPLPLGGTLSDYVPFYFTPKSPMLLNIKTGYNGIRQRKNDEIIILVTALPHIQKKALPFVFSDRHAYLAAARFTSDLTKLNAIDWPILQATDFKRDNNDLGKMERYQAEALVRNHVPTTALLAVACFSDATREATNKMLDGGPLADKALKKPNWYF
jgi:hypothetical protein